MDKTKEITGKDPDKYYTKDLSLSDLLPGDILTFSGKGEESPITKLILCFTNSWVSHGALFYQHGPVEALADAGSSGLHGHKVTSSANDRVAYVSRLTKTVQIGKNSFYSDSEMLPVLSAARGYVEQNLPYPYDDLVLLAMILLYKDHSKAGIKQAAVIGLLKVLAAEIKKLLDDKLHNKQYTMVCSSYVYQCYLDASKKNRKFKLKLTKEADLRANRKGAKVANTLLDLYAEHAAEYDYNTESFQAANLTAEPDKSLEDWAKEALESRDDQRVQLLKSNELSGAIENLLKVLMELLESSATSIKDLIQNARDMQAMFVTPNDLCFNIGNTKKIGRVHLNREDENLPLDQVKDYSKTAPSN